MSVDLLTVGRAAGRAVGRGTEMRLRSGLCQVLPTVHRSALDGAYHCGPWKAGSQVIRAVLFDPQVYRHSGLRPDDVSGSHRGIWRERARPPHHLSSAIFGTVDHLDALDPDWRSPSKAVIAVVRHPAELLDSWYRANLYSHDANPDVDRRRAELTGLSTEQGLLVSLDDEFDLLMAIMSSWCRQAEQDRNVLVVRFEDLMSGSLASWAGILQHLDVAMPPEALAKLLGRYRIGQGDRLASLGPKYKRAGESARAIPALVSEVLVDRFGHHLSPLPYAY